MAADRQALRGSAPDTKPDGTSTLEVVRVRDFETGEECELNNVVGVRALHQQRSKVGARIMQKLKLRDRSGHQRVDALEGDPNPTLLLGEPEAVAEVSLMRHKLAGELREAEEREAMRQETRKQVLAREEPKWRRKHMRAQFLKEHEAAKRDLAQMKRDHERMLAEKLIQVNLLK